MNDFLSFGYSADKKDEEKKESVSMRSSGCLQEGVNDFGDGAIGSFVRQLSTRKYNHLYTQINHYSTIAHRTPDTELYTRRMGATAPAPEAYACLVDNTTWDLVEDIEKLREHLDIPEWQVFGGSWGSTLALAYSQSHPEKVTGIVLRGIFLLRKKEIDWFYEGGAAAIFPDAWEPFRDLIPENERGSFIDAYWKRLKSDDLETQYAAARAWTKWEMMTAHFIPNEEHIKKGDDDKFSLAIARIENHYFVNRGFLASDSFLLDNIEKIRHINTIIVQGRYDVCCPMMSAWDLHKAWPEADFKVVLDAGHSANEPGITAELVAGNEKLKNIIQRNGP
ncbi:hypothetical protein RHMOL_Rhmol10G0018500 [Rhododendron molle]|uniref:Uncharacterized protein n=2 Tax=Rhododendron molle TaxID=49168 RepID=A0ACC0LZL0_RHOML|nr:hypothetical protein RHMOL_Rhmol10G0018500 [Rhododendron molle]